DPSDRAKFRRRCLGFSEPALLLSQHLELELVATGLEGQANARRELDSGPGRDRPLKLRPKALKLGHRPVIRSPVVRETISSTRLPRVGSDVLERHGYFDLAARPAPSGEFTMDEPPGQARS